MVVRIAFEAALIVWIVRFRPQFRAHPMPSVPPEIWQKLLRPTFSVLAHIIFITGPVSRTGRLRRAVTLLVHFVGGNSRGAFLGLLFFLILREGDQRFYKDPILPGRPLPCRTA
jgi:hypothetical protein